jgi:hypothetical protein
VPSGRHFNITADIFYIDTVKRKDLVVCNYKIVMSSVAYVQQV